MKKAVLVGISICVTATLLIFTGTSGAFPTYSANRDATRCRGCHGDFRSATYTSKADLHTWGNLHDVHRFAMLNGDCSTCHSGAQRFPVLLAHSNGGTGLPSISCVGCHGRTEDAGHDGTTSPGLGAGLRQHHTNAGVHVCAHCHADADSSNYTPVAESIAPPYYFTPDAAHPNKPVNACNPFGEEDYAGDLFGLDNDGDGLYDVVDRDCLPPFGTIEICHAVKPAHGAAARTWWTIRVNSAALAAHLQHGDTLGSCVE